MQHYDQVLSNILNDTKIWITLGHVFQKVSTQFAQRFRHNTAYRPYILHFYITDAPKNSSRESGLIHLQPNMFFQDDFKKVLQNTLSQFLK